jgi:hypothetical protein
MSSPHKPLQRIHLQDFTEKQLLENYLRSYVPRNMLVNNMYARMKEDIPLGDTITLVGSC